MNHSPAHDRVRRAIRMLQPVASGVVGILVMTLFVSGGHAIEPLIVKYVFDGLTRPSPLRALGIGIAALAALGIAREALSGACHWLTWRTRLSFHETILDATVGRLHRLPLSFYRENSVGSILTKVDRGVQGIVDAASQVAFSVLPSALYLGIAVTVMFRLDWRLALLVIVAAPVPPLIAMHAVPEQIQRQRGLLDRWARIYSRFNEVLAGIVTVKSFTREEEEKTRFLADVSETNREVMQGVGRDLKRGAGQNLVFVLAHVGALALGGWLVIRGEITIGTLVAFLGYVGGVFAPVQGLTGIYGTLRTASVAFETVFSILEVKDAPADAPDARDVSAVSGTVRFEHVSFHYGPDRPVLTDIDLSVDPGEVLALVGPSGAGKSTLVALLQRFYDPVAGRVLLDGADLRDLRQKSLRSHIGVVLQEPLLFDESVAANIAYGRPDATMAEIEAAARAAHAHDFISALPHRYETRVGERASRFSAGERQRIAIARALLKNPSILVLDEATSALDAESEALVQGALRRLIRGRTTFVIAHRLSTVVHADRVCVLKEGRIVELGRHADLLASNGYYASLVRRQTEPLLPVSYWSDQRRGRGRRREDRSRETELFPEAAMQG